MTFNSIPFLIFFPVVAGVYFALPYRWRWAWLLMASCYFYMAFIPVYIAVLLALIIIDYTMGILIEGAEGRLRKWYLLASILSTCGVLFIFKYYDFFNANLSQLAESFHWNYPLESLSLILPIGLSFHTFQSLSYVIEVYRKNILAQRHFGLYALYVMFFPQLVAGPIERPYNLLPQFYQKHDFDCARVIGGMKRMAWGMFQKVVIADRLAILVNQVYNHPAQYQGLSLVAATIFFAFQIYCDFGGYSNIAVGAGEVLGFRLMPNFRRPYSSRSIPEFWKRWHISLSSWFRDYLYIPLGGSRAVKSRWAFNILITFLISGFWHGANWTFMIWGALHGFYYLCSVWTRGFRENAVRALRLDQIPWLHHGIQTAVTFGLICFAWIFFRANSLHDAQYIVSHVLSGWDQPIGFENLSLGLTRNEFILAVVLIFSLLLLEGKGDKMAEPEGGTPDPWWILLRKPVWIRWAVYAAVTLSIMNLGITETIPFIYFQF